MRSLAKLSNLGPSIYFLVLLVSVTEVTIAQSQRMLLPEQEISIKASGSAEAKSFCLDFGVSTPQSTTVFRPASHDLSSITVSVAGGGSMSLAEAMQRKVIAASGTGNAWHMQFTNLTNMSVTVAVGRESLMLPDDNRHEEDLTAFFHGGVPQDSNDQVRIWQARAAPTLKRLGLTPAKFPAGYVVNPEWMAGTQEWVHSQPMGSARKAFVLDRIVPIQIVHDRMLDKENGQPMYILYTGNAPPRLFNGNGELIGASKVIRDLWSATGAPPPPRLLMRGRGTLQDFDAARLTLEAAAGGGGRLTGPGLPEAFYFDAAGGGSGPPGDHQIYEGSSWTTIPIDKKPDDTFVSTRTINKRGSIKLVSSALAVLSRMAITLKSIVPLINVLKPTREQLIVAVRSDIQDEINAIYAENPNDNFTASAAFNIDGAKTSLSFTRQKFSGPLNSGPAPTVAGLSAVDARAGK